MKQISPTLIEIERIKDLGLFLFCLLIYCASFAQNKVVLKAYAGTVNSFWESQLGIGPGIQADWAFHKRLSISMAISTGKISGTPYFSSTSWVNGIPSTTTLRYTVYERTTPVDFLFRFDFLGSKRHDLTLGIGMSMAVVNFDYPDSIFVPGPGDYYYDGGTKQTNIELLPMFQFEYDWKFYKNFHFFSKVVYRIRTDWEAEIFRISNWGIYDGQIHQYQDIVPYANYIIGSIAIGFGYEL
jgi:hypothetical protein